MPASWSAPPTPAATIVETLKGIMRFRYIFVSSINLFVPRVSFVSICSFIWWATEGVSGEVFTSSNPLFIEPRRVAIFSPSRFSFSYIGQIWSFCFLAILYIIGKLPIPIAPRAGLILVKKASDIPIPANVGTSFEIVSCKIRSVDFLPLSNVENISPKDFSWINSNSWKNSELVIRSLIWWLISFIAFANSISVFASIISDILFNPTYPKKTATLNLSWAIMFWSNEGAKLSTPLDIK